MNERNVIVRRCAQKEAKDRKRAGNQGGAKQSSDNAASRIPYCTLWRGWVSSALGRRSAMNESRLKAIVLRIHRLSGYGETFTAFRSNGKAAGFLQWDQNLTSVSVSERMIGRPPIGGVGQAQRKLTVPCNGSKRRGLTLIEVLVLIAIVIVIAALLLPHLSKARPATLRLQCSNNLHQIQTAFFNYEASHRALPGYINAMAFHQPITIDDKSIESWPVGWPVMILREIDRYDLHAIWKEGGDKSFLVADNSSPIRWVEVLYCPEDPASETIPQPLAYAVNTGMADVRATEVSPADNQANGMFFNRFCDAQGPWDSAANVFKHQIITTSYNYARDHDGLATTILLAENRDKSNRSWFYLPGKQTMQQSPNAEAELGIVWWANSPASRPAADLWRLNGEGEPLGGQSAFGDSRIEYARPASHHIGGAHIAFCDGAVRFVSQSIDYGVYCQLMSPHGAQVAPPAGSLGVNQSTFKRDGYAELRDSPNPSLETMDIPAR